MYEKVINATTTHREFKISSTIFHAFSFMTNCNDDPQGNHKEVKFKMAEILSDLIHERLHVADRIFVSHKTDKELVLEYINKSDKWIREKLF